jgi:sulfite reductase alpha subunit
MAKHETPLLDQLESGPWPSFVSDLKQEAASRAKNENNVEFQIAQDVCEDILGRARAFLQAWPHPLETRRHRGRFRLRRRRHRPLLRPARKFPGVAHFHTMRVNQPASKFYTTEYLKNLCDLWEFRGSGITNMHGSTGDIIFLGTTTPQLEEIFYELTHKLEPGPGRLRFQPADPGRLYRHRPAASILLRHPGPLLLPDQGIPGRAAPSGVPL